MSVMGDKLPLIATATKVSGLSLSQQHLRFQDFYPC